MAPGESFSLIAVGEYGDASIAAALWEANRGRAMGDGRSFTSPNLVYPGWVLRLPTGTSTSGPSTTPRATTPRTGGLTGAGARPDIYTVHGPDRPQLVGIAQAVPDRPIPGPGWWAVTPTPPLASADPAPQGPTAPAPGGAIRIL